MGGGPATWAYFRVVYDYDTPVHWYKFAIGEEEGEDLTPIHLTPFSKVNQLAFSTIVGMAPFIYCLGGESPFYCLEDASNSLCNTAYRYDTSYSDLDPNPYKPWERLPDMIRGRSEPQAVVANGKIFVMGGLHPMSNEKILLEDWAEFYDPHTRKWTILTVRYNDEEQKMRLYSILNPTADPSTEYTPILLNPFQILLASHISNAHSAYLFDARDHSLQKLDPKMYIMASSDDSFVNGDTQFFIDWHSGQLNRIGMKDQTWITSRKSFSVGIDHDKDPMNSCKLLRLDGLSDASDNAKQFHAIWFSRGGDMKHVALYYTCLKFLEEMGPNQVSDFFIKCTRCYFLPAGMALTDGLVL